MSGETFEISGMMPKDNINSFKYDRNTKKFQVLDQTLLPEKIEYIDVPNCEKGISVIKNMQVRGAPLIAAVGCLSIIAELNQPEYLSNENFTPKALYEFFKEKSDSLLSARPTAINLTFALNRIEIYLSSKTGSFECTTKDLIYKITELCEKAIDYCLELNIKLADFGADAIIESSQKSDRLVVLTHCNTGSLATVGYGTALGVIRSLNKKGKLERVYCTETRPYNQGSRLTALELVQEKIPATLIADSMVAFLMAKHKIDAVIVGCDCVAKNADTANKIGTFQIAVIAKFYKIPFYVAAPTRSIDLNKNTGSNIEIEFRPAKELKKMHDIVLAPNEVDVWNPCFDITPGELITGFITEYGVYKPNNLKDIKILRDIECLY